jgi:peptide/nickel transport system ATP-binding protein
MTTDFTHNPVLLDVRDLDVHYVSSADQPPARALEDVSFILREGEMLGVVGESGCGKTTLMLSLMRLLPDAGRIVSGQIICTGRDLLDLSESEMEAVRWKEISMIFQGAMNALNPVQTVGDQIAEAISWHNLATDKKRLDERVCQLLELVGISTNRRRQYPHQFSGGMRQRVMIAMALACNPHVIIADEPTTALDVMIQAQILELLLDLRQKLGLAVLFVTHDLGVVAEVCDTVLVMYGGVVAEYAEVDTIFNSPQHPYTQRLLQAFPDLSDSTKDRRLASIPGYPPRLNNLPSGCRFAPRCPYVFERCHEAQPPLYRLGNTKQPHDVSCYLLESR